MTNDEDIKVIDIDLKPVQQPASETVKEKIVSGVGKSIEWVNDLKDRFTPEQQETMAKVAKLLWTVSRKN